MLLADLVEHLGDCFLCGFELALGLGDSGLGLFLAKHLAKKCVKDAGPCLALCAAGTAVALLAVLGPFDVLRSASSLHVCMALAGAMMTGGVLDLIFWVFDPFGWKNEG